MKNPREKHGMTDTKFYRCWSRMKSKCLNPQDDHFKWYGGRGIKICNRWSYSFLSFKADMYESYQKHLDKYGPKNTTIDRIDTDGPYNPENCRWTTIEQQALNKRWTGKQIGRDTILN